MTLTRGHRTDISSQMPWLIGPALSISMDLLLLSFSWLVWGPKWEKSERFRNLNGITGQWPGDAGTRKTPALEDHEKRVEIAKHHLLEEEESLDEFLYDEEASLTMLHSGQGADIHRSLQHGNNTAFQDDKAAKMAVKDPKKAWKKEKNVDDADRRHATYKADHQLLKEKRTREQDQEAERVARRTPFFSKQSITC